MSVPEALITALAWRTFEVDSEPVPDGRTLALVYRMRPRAKEPLTLTFRESIPKGEDLALFAEELALNGVVGESGGIQIAAAISEDLGGVVSGKGGVQAATPITPASAMLQNMVGLQSAAHPPAVDKILERMFALGTIEDQVEVGAARLWRRAAEHRCSVDPLASAIDRSLQAGVLRSSLRDRATLPTEEAPYFQGTPFEWFFLNWTRITDPLWVEALPARVWVDWASTVLRLALGCGYLWEGAWYEHLAQRIVLSEIPTTSEALVSGVPPTLPWVSRAADVSVRDLASPIGWRVRRGDQIRNVLSSWIESSGLDDEDAMDCLQAMSRDQSLCDSLADALGSRAKPASANNLWEAIKYALKTREVSGPGADHYGLLSGSGRYLYFSPGAEWTAAIASLACSVPGGVANVGQLQRELGMLGLHPELAELIYHLERAGVARGSADADQGVEITAAFEGAIS